MSDTTKEGKGILGGVISGVAAVITACAALAGIFWGPALTERFFFPSPSPSPISPSETAPVLSTQIPVLLDTETHVSPTSLNTLSAQSCNWQAYSNGESKKPDPALCLADVVFGDIGIADKGNQHIEFLASTNQAGIYGILLPLGQVTNINNNFNFTLKLNVKDLTAARFLVAFGPGPGPDAQFTYAIAVTPISNELILKYFFYKVALYPNEYTFSVRSPINTVQGVDYTVKFAISYPSVVVDVNSGGFRPKAEQINFNGPGYIFIGYQRISSQVSRTRIQVDVSLP